ncbi:MAG: beta-ketoacyl-ACP synthase III [Acidobacteriota bacterium]
MDKRKRKIRFSGIGMYVPEKILTNADLEKIVDTSDEWITTRSGIKERRILEDDKATSDMCIEAGRMALQDAGLKANEIDLIILATSTPDTIFPATACWVQKGLGAEYVPAFDLSAACSGFLYALIVAEGLIFSGNNKKILVIAAESLSKITNWKDRNTCVLFGDGAGAVVVEESFDESGILSHYWGVDGNLTDLLLQPGGGSRIPLRPENIDQDLQYLHMKGNEVFKHAVKRMGEAALEAIKMAGLKRSDVNYLFPHQANIRIIEATGRRLKLPPEKVFINIHKYGNMSCATIPIGIFESRRDGLFEKGDNLVLVAFGAGFTWASIVYRW